MCGNISAVANDVVPAIDALESEHCESSALTACDGSVAVFCESTKDVCECRVRVSDYSDVVPKCPSHL